MRLSDEVRAYWEGTPCGTASEIVGELTPRSLEWFERVEEYRPGGFHPMVVGDLFAHGRHRVIHKLAFGSYSTIWLARDQLRPHNLWITQTCTFMSGCGLGLPDFGRSTVVITRRSSSEQSLILSIFAIGPRGSIFTSSREPSRLYCLQKERTNSRDCKLMAE